MGCASSNCSSVTVARNGDAPQPGVDHFQAIAPQQQQPAVEKNFHDAYVLAGKLGSGAFAAVYLAHKVGSTEDVAVKVADLRQQRNANGSWNTPDMKRRQASTKEVLMLKTVSGKPYVIKFYEAYCEGALSYIVAEKMDSSLLQVLERIPDLTEKSIKRIFSEMLQGLGAVHAVGVVHRDVKPDNFLCVGPESTVKLCDFGLAASMESNRNGLTGIFGTPPFMAPEMLAGTLYGDKVDTWSIGVIAYVLFFGQFPYKPVEPTGPAMKAAILAGTPAPSFKPKHGLESTNSASRISSDAVNLLRELLNRDVDDRPTAEQALKHNFFRKVPDPDQPQASLRPMLYSAKRMGAFDIPNSKQKTTDVDIKLSELQEKRYGPGAGGPARLGQPQGHGQRPHHGGNPSRQERTSSGTPAHRPKKVSPSDTSTDVGSDVCLTDNSAAGTNS